MLAESGFVTESVSFGSSSLVYELRTNNRVSTLSAEYADSRITILIPGSFAKEWNDNNTVGIEAKQEIGGGKFLILLAEKDFQCLDETTEDQSDNYVNPNSSCA